MHFLGLILVALARVLRLLINLYTFIVGAAALISWVNPDPYNPIVRFLHQTTDPVFRKVRPLLPRFLFQTGIDFTPIVIFVLLILMDTIVVGWLFELASSFLSN